MMRTLKSKVKVIIEKTSTGFSAYAKDYPVYTTGSNFTELFNNILEALNFYYEEKKIVVTPENIDPTIDLKQFFNYYKVLNSSYLAKRIGMNKTLLSQYVSGKKIPSSRQTKRIVEGVNAIGKELSEIQLV